MNDKEYYRICSLLFLLIAVAHAVRAFYGWDAVIAGVEIPVWCSWVAVVLAGYLAFRGFSKVNELSRSPKRAVAKSSARPHARKKHA